MGKEMNTQETITSDSIALAHNLMLQKDAIEEEVVQQEQVLRGQGIGMHEPLVDQTGFPRDDVDIVAIRTARARIIALRNDHKDIMSKIEQALHTVHAEAQAKKRVELEKAAKLRVNALIENANYAEDTQPIPFAIVNAVAPDSPANDSGLLKGDKILRFGSVHAGNHEKLQALNKLVGESEGRTIEVTIERDASSATEKPAVYVLSLTPRRGWGGRGLLGCHILPI